MSEVADDASSVLFLNPRTHQKVAHAIFISTRNTSKGFVTDLPFIIVIGENPKHFKSKTLVVANLMEIDSSMGRMFDL